MLYVTTLKNHIIHLQLLKEISPPIPLPEKREGQRKRCLKWLPEFRTALATSMENFYRVSSRWKEIWSSNYKTLLKRRSYVLQGTALNRCYRTECEFRIRGVRWNFVLKMRTAYCKALLISDSKKDPTLCRLQKERTSKMEWVAGRSPTWELHAGLGIRHPIPISKKGGGFLLQTLSATELEG